jgi:glycosyltransferase involved in cell wall biosynthesis
VNDAQDAVRFAAIIPAYRPDERLLQLLADLSGKSIPAMVVVDDGSGPAYREIFRRAEEFPKVRLVRHAVNLGKGAALKSGFNSALCAFPDLQGVITADADGQHDPDDIEQVAARLAAQPGRLVLGSRTFSGEVPLRSRAGNVITRAVMHALVGQNISDTQTGLRGIPATLLPQLLRTEANGYDFELDMLIAVRQQAIEIDEIPIRTIYEPGNRTSHFNPLIDSMKIYFVLLRFSSVSLTTAALDSLVFYLAYRRLGNLALSQALGRAVAVAFNYSMVRRAVFFSKLQHASVLPKYLLLVCLSGTASYAGIQFLNSRFHIQPLPAKLLVETLLFFANFAIQRDFIFGKSPAVAGAGPVRARWIDRLPVWVSHAILGAAAFGLVCVTFYGFRAAGWLPDAGWTPVGRRRLLHYTEIYAIFSAAVILIAPAAFAPVLVTLVLVATAAAIGPGAVLAVVLFLISAGALGHIFMGRRHDSSAESQLCATMLGVAAYIFIMNCGARLPINYPVVYAVMLAIPVALDVRGVGRRLKGLLISLRGSIRINRHTAWSFALLGFVLGIHWLFIPQPESSADGLAMHLAIPHNIALHHILTYKPDRVLWSVMPMGADWCYTLVYVLGGEYAARLLNFCLLLLVELMLYRVARRFVTPAIAFLILALLASTSLVQMVTDSLFVENFLAAMVFGAVLAIWRFGETAERPFLYAAAALGGTAMAVKLGGLAYLVAILPLAIVEARRRRKGLGAKPALTAAIAIVLVLAAALPPYLISWRMTRDPVFPFLNQRFPSPLLPTNASFTDFRFNQPLTWHTLFDLTFHSNRYYEGRDGSLGFHNLLLVPLGFIALIVVRRRSALGAAWVSLGASVVVLKFLPNARYLYPSLPLLLLPLAALLGWLTPAPLRRILVTMAVACVILNAWYLPSSDYEHGNFYERSPLSRAMRQVYLHQCAPMREIGQYMNRQHPGAPILLTNSSELAAFDAEVYTNGWHQYGVWSRLRMARSPQEVSALLNGWNVHYVAAPKPAVGFNIQPQTLADLVRKCSTPEYQSTSYYLAHLEEGCQPPAARQPLLVSPGYYDDFDPAIVYRGGWGPDTVWPKAFKHTLTYTNLPGSEVDFAFQGDMLEYIYTKASNRGMASVTIDGIHKATLDLYAPTTQWQFRTIFASLGRRPHLAVITVLPGKNPKSSDTYVDVDAFEVQ